MNQSFVQTPVDSPADLPVEPVLRAELAHGDALLGTIAPILRHLLANDDHSLFNDEIIARVRGILGHVAVQLLDGIALAADAGQERGHSGARVQHLIDGLVANPAVLAHVHALALEWQLTERMQARLGLDPVLSPLLQALIASTEPSIAGTAMALLAAQARFAQAQRRMQLPLDEFPGELLHQVLSVLHQSDLGEPAHIAGAEAAIRAQYDESRGRLGLITRLVTGMGGGATAALSVTHAGVGIFLSALALASGQERDAAVLSTNEGQLARLALGLRAAGLKPASVEEQFLSLHPDVSLPAGFEQLGSDRAAALLAVSVAYPSL